MLTPTLMAQMDYGHFLAAGDCEIGPLTSTDLERELLARLEVLLNDHDGELTQAAEKYDLSAEDIKTLGDALIEDTTVTVALLKVLAAASIDDPDTLKSRLALAQQFHALAEDAGDVFTRRARLTTPTNEQLA